MKKRLAPQSNNNAAAAGSNYGSIANVRNDYERGDIVLGDVKKQNNVGIIALGRNDAPKANGDYGVLPSNGFGSVVSDNGYGTLPSGDGYGVLPSDDGFFTSLN